MGVKFKASSQSLPEETIQEIDLVMVGTCEWKEEDEERENDTCE